MLDDLNIAVSVDGRFHGFNLAQQLEKHGHLAGLLTSYPKSMARRYGVPGERVRSLVSNEAIRRAWRRMPGWVRRFGDPEFRLKKRFDKWAAWRIPERTRIFVGWSSNSLFSIRAAKSQGALTILERGSSHMATQLALLHDEYQSLGLPGTETHPGIVERELAEYAEADLISVPSLFVKRSFLEQGFPESRLIHNPYGVDLSRFYPEGKTDSTFRVLFCGNLSARKGIHYLLQAFASLARDDVELCLLGPKAPETDELVRRYARGNVRVLGAVPQDKLRRFYSQGSVFCMPSIEEGLAMVQPQAMACGLPLICTTNTGGEDLIEPGVEGFVVPIRDAEALKEKLSLLYEDPERRTAMGEAARRKVSKGLTWDDYGARMVRYYRHALDQIKP